MAEKAKIEKVEKTITGLNISVEIILVYIVSILGFIFSFMNDKEVSDRAKFAYNQAGALFLCHVVLSSLSVIPYIGLLFLAITTIIFAFTIVTIIKGYQGEDYKIPIIYDFAELIWGNKNSK